jgi:5'(3')-deoxyribonucleotidase
MKKPVIAVDLDDVLLPHYEDLITWHNREYGTHLTLANKDSWDPKPWGSETVEEAIQRVHNYFSTDDFKNEQPFEDAIRAINILGQKYELIIITARDEIIEQATLDWVSKHFKDVFAEVHFTAHFSLTGKSRSKADVAVEAGAAYFIDDNAKTVLEVAERGIPSIIFGSFSDGVSELPDNVKRCKDWHSVLEYFDEA